MKVAFALALFLALALAGCLTESGSTSTKKSLGGPDQKRPTSVPPTISKLVPVAPQVLVSPAGHRMAEFMVARNPLDANHLILAALDYDSGTGTLACVLYVSRDGGATWAQSQPVPGLQRSHLQFDGWVSFDLKGVAHFICLDTAGQTGQTFPYYSHSTDGGTTWSPAVHIPTATDGQSTDKSSIHAGRDGTVYAAFSGQVARTSDNGKTWQKGKNTGTGSNPNGFAEDSLGTVYLWVRGQGGGRVARTTDRGETWNASVVGPFAIPPGYSDQNRWVDQRPWTTLPSIAVHPITDQVFVAQQSWNSTTSLYETSVYRSDDHGVSFQKVGVANFTSASCAPCHVTKPSIAFDDVGRLGLLVQLTNDGGHIKEVWFSASADEGATWVEPLVLSKTAPPNGWANPRAFTPSPNGFVGLANGLAAHPTDAVAIVAGFGLTTAVQELQMRWNGEYWGIAASPQGFVATWIDHAAGGVPQLWSRLVRAE